MLFDSLTTVRTQDPMFRRVQAVHDALNLCRAMWTRARREPAGDVSAVYLTKSKIELPEFAEFEAKWGLRFPVPPHAAGPPERLMCAPITHPVRIVSDDPPKLVLDIWRPAGKSVLDHLVGILDQYQDHRDDVLPPRWSLERIDEAVRGQFGPSASDAELVDEVSEYQKRLARAAGYSSYVNLTREVARLPARSSAAEEEQARIAETEAAMDSLRRPGIPPRLARKSGGPYQIGIQEQSDGWLRVTLAPPESVDYAELATKLTGDLNRASLTIRLTDEPAHRRIFQAYDLSRRRLTAPQIAEVMELEDSEDRGRERVAELKKAYGDLVGRLHVPALPDRR